MLKERYSKYSADKLCAIKELRMVGAEISEEYEKQLINSMVTLIQQRLAFMKKHDAELNSLCGFDNDDNFAMIMGYTSGRFLYGLTHEEMKEITKEE